MIQHSQSQQNMQDIISPPEEALQRQIAELNELSRQLQATNETASRAVSGASLLLQAALERLQRR